MRVSFPLPPDRRNVIANRLRRDLRALAQTGIRQRAYGGALPLWPASRPFGRRNDETTERKRAMVPAMRIPASAHETPFLDTGSTNLCLAECLPANKAGAS
jgi:DeoR/GlpR family transcriptional regulator of sugar metabolism